ncbi:MAG: hypothetical protein F6K23_10695 [Okeania sp. SIO2C9]|uniref:hypothetical protein n=1 Tax=Okeania sp. SIO2C9 TaxID=2607791 RepID=UPI0013C240D9|nr:hypothetical protein [Okeania sp. SIO2C9]NEQ73494.1 hypothetical protein [Okeania sp. SIO2C9]
MFNVNLPRIYGSLISVLQKISSRSYISIMHRRQMYLLGHEKREQETKVRILDSLSIFGFLTNHLDLLNLRKLLTLLIVVVLTSGLVSCSDRFSEQPQLSEAKPVTTSISKILEVSPPEIIQQLRQAIDIYKPQVTIQSPQPDQIFEDNTITVQLQVKDLPIFKSELDLGPYVEVILDNKPYKKIYDLNQPLILSDLEPGTHTIRVFACRPWDESFKNEGAYAQTTFHIFTKTTNNNPAPNLPLLTYNSPLGDYGAEPILLDYYLTNAPSHLVAQEDPEDEIVDWRIRVTVNGTSFITDQWQSIYLEGFHPGKNWIKLEYIDDEGNALNEIYNSTIALITYKPGGQDVLSKIIAGEISLKEAYSIVDPEYIYQETQPELTPELEIEDIPTAEPEEIEVEEILITPEVEDIPTAEPEEIEAEEILITPEIEDIPTAEPEKIEVEETLITPEVEDIPTAEPEEIEVEEIPTTEAEEIEVEEIPTTEAEIEVEETFTEEATSKIETTEANELPITKEKIGEFVNRVRDRFKGLINKVTEKQKSATLDTIEKPNLEENFNPSEKSEVQDSLQENEFPSLPEIVEEVPTPESVEKLPPQETSALTPNVEESNESVENPSTSIPEVVEDFPQDTISESEQITEQNSEVVVEPIPTESNDSTISIPEAVEDFPQDTIPDSEQITEQNSEVVVEPIPTESNDSTISIPEAVEDFQQDTTPDLEQITEQNSEVVVEPIPTENDDSTISIPEVVEDFQQDTTPDSEQITEQNSEVIVEPIPTENDDSTISIPEVVEDFQQDTTPDLEQIMEQKPEVVVESISPESDDSIQEITEEIESENNLDSPEEIIE